MSQDRFPATQSVEQWLESLSIAVLIPAYRVELQIEEVLISIPDYVRHVIVVDDASPDRTSEVVSQFALGDPRIMLLKHEQNQGVGGAMITAFRKALELEADIAVKVDGDGQMDCSYLTDLLSPIVHGEADYAKGNRFRDFQALRKMPHLRRIGNLGLSFLTKAATGYWTCFDPTNGYLAIRGDVLAQLSLENLDKRYFFETSMLSNLYLLNAKLADVPIPAKYGAEVSNLSIKRVLFEFPPRLFKALIKRLLLKTLIYDFSMETIYLFSGLPMLVFGTGYGLYKWMHFTSLKTYAPTGTIMIPTLLVILGFQLLLAAIQIDMESVPKTPLFPRPLAVRKEQQIALAAHN